LKEKFKKILNLKLLLKKNTFKKIALITLIAISIPATLVLIKQRQELRKKAHTGQEIQPLQLPEPEFNSNELLVKFKDKSKYKIKKENPQDTGITTINNSFKKYKVTTFQKAFKETPASKKDSDVFQWYLVSLEGDNKKIKYDDPEAKVLQEFKSELLKDENIEIVEPNYNYYLLQDLTPTSEPDNPPDPTSTSSYPVTLTSTVIQENESYNIRYDWQPLADPTASLYIWGGECKVGTYGPGELMDSIPVSTKTSHTYSRVGLQIGDVVCAQIWKDFFAEVTESNPSRVEIGLSPTPTPTPYIEHPITLSSSIIPSGEDSIHSILYEWNPPTNDTSSSLYIWNGDCKSENYGPGDLIWSEPTTTKTSYIHSPVTYGNSYCGQIWTDFFDNIPASNPSPVAFITPTPDPSTPNDPFYQSQGSWGQGYDDLWGIKKINSDSAWSVTTGSDNVVVAVIDTGIDMNHEDLKENMWVNVDEIPDNGIDDDNNGYIDDYQGWDFGFTTKSDDDDNDPMDDNSHGTHVAGTIAAVGNNNIGVVGVNWKTKLMPIKVFNSSGSGNSFDIAKAHIYAADNGAHISSNSYGGPFISAIQEDALKYAHEKGMTIVVAAGNSNKDALNYQPALSDYVITVGATDSYDSRASFSNRGEKIDVVAPGVDILSTKSSQATICSSTTINSNYCRLSGTSMSTPHVSGLAALILANNSSLTNEEIRQLLRIGAKDIGDEGKDKYFGYGRIDATNSLLKSSEKPIAPIITNVKSRTEISGQTTLVIEGSVSGSNFSNYKIEAAKYDYILKPYSGGYTMAEMRSPTDWNTLAGPYNTPVTSGALASIDLTRLNDGFYTFRVSAEDNLGNIYQYQIHDLRIDSSAISGWPKEFYCQEWASCSNYVPAIEDINGDGLKELIIATENDNLGDLPNSGQVHVFNKNGTYLNGFPVNINAITGPAHPRLEMSTPINVVDLDNDGKKEIIISVYQSNYKKQIFIIDYQGNIRTGWPITLDNISSYTGEHLTPSVSDLDNDGFKEIVLINGYNEFQVLKPNGAIVSEFNKGPFSSSDLYVGQLSILDLDNDNSPEIAVGKPGEMYLFDNTGNILPGWPYAAPLFNDYPINFYTSPSMGDLDGDGTFEIISTATSGSASILTCSKYPQTCQTFIYAWNKDGSLVDGWPKQTSPSNDWPAQYSPTTVDIDADGKDEIVVGLGKLSIFDIEGEKILTRQPESDYQPVISDLDGDNNFEISTAKKWSSVVDIVKEDGTSFWKTSLFNMPMNAGVIADMDNNGKMEFAIASSKGPFYNWDQRLKIYLWEIPNESSKAHFNWSMYAHDPARTGNVPEYPIQLQAKPLVGRRGVTWAIDYKWSTQAPPQSSLYIWNGSECKTSENGYDPGDLLWSQPTSINTEYRFRSWKLSRQKAVCSQIWIDFNDGISGSNPVKTKTYTIYKRPQPIR